MDIVTQKQAIVQCEALTDSGQTVEDSSGHSDTEKTDSTVCLLTDLEQNTEDSSEHSDTEY